MNAVLKYKPAFMFYVQKGLKFACIREIRTEIIEIHTVELMYNFFKRILNHRYHLWEW